MLHPSHPQPATHPATALQVRTRRRAEGKSSSPRATVALCTPWMSLGEAAGPGRGWAAEGGAEHVSGAGEQQASSEAHNSGRCRWAQPSAQQLLPGACPKHAASHPPSLCGSPSTPICVASWLNTLCRCGEGARGEPGPPEDDPAPPLVTIRSAKQDEGRGVCGQVGYRGGRPSRDQQPSTWPAASQVACSGHHNGSDQSALSPAPSSVGRSASASQATTASMGAYAVGESGGKKGVCSLMRVPSSAG